MKNPIKLFFSACVAAFMVWLCSIMLKGLGLTHIQILYVALIYLGLTILSLLSGMVFSFLMSKRENREKFNFKKALEDDGK
ncbi:hypothetical protein BXO87_02320 [Bacillus sp. GZB]|uniref:hypothetical protein n=1 Tax=Bacillus TaxID=1386 RepID=UPI0009772C56|nr:MULTISPECIES: hypothetical protein [Bacillus]MCZ4246957.1 hypothetical protein [Bacillus amyloliquefaciens]OMQ06861.1 hypothetical protein BXO87_02320 [Bacillus sp. GZB]